FSSSSSSSSYFSINMAIDSLKIPSNMLSYPKDIPISENHVGQRKFSKTEPMRTLPALQEGSRTVERHECEVLQYQAPLPIALHMMKPFLHAVNSHDNQGYQVIVTPILQVQAAVFTHSASHTSGWVPHAISINRQQRTRPGIHFHKEMVVMLMGEEVRDTPEFKSRFSHRLAQWSLYPTLLLGKLLSRCSSGGSSLSAVRDSSEAIGLRTQGPFQLGNAMIALSVCCDR
ncbi:hypothetical protein STEG23_015222, partial [Scotinomys teguina]